MINGKKIGVGVVTCNRPELFCNLIRSFDNVNDVDQYVIVEDVHPTAQKSEYDFGYGAYAGEILSSMKHSNWFGMTNGSNLGVGKSKNRCLEILSKDCDYVFLIEDDIYIKDPKVFEKYIEASQKTGIQHFNYSQHGMMNKSWPGGNPNPRTILNYESSGLNIPLYPHCVGAFSFYTKEALEKVGLLDPRYYNACEHVDHTLSIIKGGMHPPFWYFADIENSWEYLGDEEWSIQQSTISSRKDHQDIMTEADKVFIEKHGYKPGQIPDSDFSTVVEKIKQIKKTYAV